VRSFASYLLIVIPPLCGLLAILRLGQAIEPPRSIGGSWVLDPATHAHCASLSFFESSATLQVAQSGPRAELAFADAAQTTLALRIDADRVVGEGVDRASPACGALALEARLGRDTLTGTLRRPGCDCPPIAFRATRTPRTPH
jgi:hypothetical protein